MAVLFLGVVTIGCNTDQPTESTARNRTESNVRNEPQTAEADPEQEAEIRRLIEQLVFSDGPAKNQPIVNPNMKIVDADGNAKPISGESDGAEMRRQKFNACQDAFTKLYEMKQVAIPFLVEHLDDKRQSINFRNHYMGNSVGNACYWNIYFQLQDRPRDYSRYGYSRKGRDGKSHPKPYWEGTPFDEAGGLREWLEANKDKTYTQKQLKCLEWLLEKEKAIGASDADSYFLNILPLEIRILERRLENGEDVQSDLDHFRKIKADKLVNAIPKNLLPDQISGPLAFGPEFRSLVLSPNALAIWINRSIGQRNAVASIQKLDGFVEYAAPRNSLGFDTFLGRDFFADAIGVKFFWYDYNHPDFDLPVYYEVEELDEILIFLKRLPKLKRVTLYYLRQAPYVEKYKKELPNVEFIIVE